MSRISPLSEAAAAQIHSSKTITTLQGVVLALLENSFDAGATKVEISLDFRRADCTIEDNGTGIFSDEFLLTGGLGRMYHTSKRAEGLSSREVHGTAGIYLASLAALCLLSVTSKRQDCPTHATLVLHAGRVISRHVPGPLQDELSATSGTRVIVRDLFGNMPVRVKQRALANEAGVEDERLRHELKKGITALLLAWHGPCTVRLKDLHDRKSVVLSSGLSASGGMLTKASLNSRDGRVRKHELRDRLPLLFQAGLVSMESRYRFDPVTASTLTLSIKGFICLDPAPTRQGQFISLGIHPLIPTDGHNELYESINHVFANSSFGAVDKPEVDEAEKDKRARDRRFKNDGYTQKQLHGRKGVDRWPIFVLQFKFENPTARATRDNVSNKELKAMADLLRATATHWLDAHHFRPRKLRRNRIDDQTGPASHSSSPRRSSTADGLFRRLNSTLATPSVKRAATMESLTTSKRVCTGGYPEVSSLVPFDGSMKKPSNYFSSLSRIKSGRPESRKACIGSKSLAKAKPNILRADSESHPFVLPSFGKGVLSSKGIATLGSKVSAMLTPASPSIDSGSKQDFPTVRIDSDDYGSVDDSALIAAYDEANYMAPSRLTSADSQPEAQASDSIVNWLDPSTKQVYHINSRTGVVLPLKAGPRQNTQDEDMARSKAAINTSRTAAGNVISLARRPKTAVESRSEQWLPGFLQQWDNPVFVRQDAERIPVASFDGPGLDLADIEGQRCTHHTMTQYFVEAGVKLSSQLSKKALASVRVIEQVDAKFILCAMPSSEAGDGRRTLVLVDQHAASERVVLEGLFAALCQAIDPSSPAAAFVSNLGCKSAVPTVLLEKPQRFQVSGKEHELFRQHAGRFAKWGVLYDLKVLASNIDEEGLRAQKSEQHLLSVTTLPPGMAERCVLFPHLLIELLRSEVWESGTSTKRTLQVNDNAENHAWLRRVGSCPKGIIDMLNSRACRSAIMFNDMLSIEDCEKLLHDLSTCVFPFMCAHGRVSMVPLIEMVGSAADAGEEGFVCEGSTLRNLQSEGSDTFTKAFEQWRCKSVARNEQALR
ncbi:DNA mismatch repair protein [Recurvomyces mirabilis]|uniref:DNA mismatch repair protein n=1 Tax=Recurvomyces mirabilis TaxID=574656 RepID=A0AAE0WL98_9PEZI|nr:DNA mismatch repair protein [Recurvomyces mirabilis]KAK5152227.1 DNA mismatch repair protein [Recurvomyces mirabilis]